MDNTIVDTLPVLNQHSHNLDQHGVTKPDQIPGIFRNLASLPGAIDGINQLTEYYDLYILSTAPWYNPSAWQDKLDWLTEHFGNDAQSPFYKKVVLAHQKDLVKNNDAILLDDRPYHGASAWNDTQLDSFWLQYGYDQHLVWQDQLVPFLIEIAQAPGNSLHSQINFANHNHHYDLHSPNDDFKKEGWE